MHLEANQKYKVQIKICTAQVARPTAGLEAGRSDREVEAECVMGKGLRGVNVLHRL